MHVPISPSTPPSTSVSQPPLGYHKVILVCEKCEKIISFYMYSYNPQVVDRNTRILCKECFKSKN